MKNSRIFKIFCLALCVSFMAFGQRSKELKCFDNFEFANSNRSEVNAYLLAMVNYYMYPQNLLNVEDGASAAVALSQNNDQFLIEFKAKMKPWFLTNKNKLVSQTMSVVNKNNLIKKKPVKMLKTPSTNEPVIEFIYENNNAGYDPEVMLISTNDYILLAWRGTDRVSSTTPIIGGAIFGFGEWVQTNFDFPLVNAPSNIPGKVHRGFNSSIHYNGLLNRLADRLVELDVHSKKLWITGHSLGGAHAQLSALYLKEQHDIQPYSVYAYASPGIGNERFCNAIEAVLPGSKLQRFTYIYDPVPRVPSARIPGMGDYDRAGQLNYYTSEQGKNYNYDYPQKPEFPMPFACHHHPNWYARAAYFELIDKKPALSNSLPNAPNMPTKGCTAIDTKLANGNGSGFIQSLLGIDQDLVDGNYYIVNAKSGKYLSLNPSDFEGNGNPLRLNDFATDRRFKWNLKSIPQSPYGGYVIKSKKVDKVIDAQWSGVGEQNSMVQTWDRLSWAIPVRTHQEWEIERQNNGRFRIKNLKNRQFKLKATNTNRIVLDDNNAASSEWFFVKI